VHDRRSLADAREGVCEALRVIEGGGVDRGLRAVAEGRWRSDDTERWKTLGITELGCRADDGQSNVDFLRIWST
jgi:hypothetical protein